MTSLTERAYFKWHAAEIFSGTGAIVDLGSWLGSTTATLAMGLGANPRPATRNTLIHAFDRFVWEPWMDDYANLVRFGPYSSGDSFLPDFESVVQSWRDRIEVHAGDLCDQKWNGGPIEVLLVDAMKAWDVTRHIASEFFRGLIEGRGYVIHQDFANCWTPWIHLLSHRLRDYLVPVKDIPASETVVFRLVRSLDGCAEALDTSRASFDDAAVAAAFEYSLQITQPDKHSGIRAAQAILMVYDGDLAGAERRAEIWVSKGQLSDFHANAVRIAVENEIAGSGHSASE